MFQIIGKQNFCLIRRKWLLSFLGHSLERKWYYGSKVWQNDFWFTVLDVSLHLWEVVVQLIFNLKQWRWPQALMVIGKQICGWYIRNSCRSYLYVREKNVEEKTYISNVDISTVVDYNKWTILIIQTNTFIDANDWEKNRNFFDFLRQVLWIISLLLMQTRALLGQRFPSYEFFRFLLFS